MKKTPWLTEQQQTTWLAYLELTRALSAGMERQLAQTGVSGADYQVLAPLAEVDDGLRPRELCRFTGWDRSRLTHHVNRMEARGLVERSPCGDDKRGTVVRITAAGRTALGNAAPSHVEWVRSNFIGLLTDHEMAVLVDISARVRATINSG